MGIAGNTLDLIRTVFNRDGLIPKGASYFDSINSNAISYSNVTLGPQNGYNDYLTDSVKLDQDLMSRYADYEDMDDFPELGSALDLFSDDATVQDVITNKSMWFEAEDESVSNVLNEMLDINIKAEESLWEICRSLCKYGNNFEELMVADGIGVVKLNHIPPPAARRIEDINGILYGFIHDPTMHFRMDTRSFLERLQEKVPAELSPLPQDSTMQDLMQVYEPWEVVHFRLRGKTRRDLYGYSVAEAARWAWKRLSMMEDAMVLYKLTRSPQRYAYYVDVGDVPPNQAKGFLNRIKNEFKKEKFIDKDGKLSFRYNPLCISLGTRIPLLNGKTKFLRDLIDDYNNGIENWTYSIDPETKKMKPGRIEWAGITRRNAKVIRVTLDNNESVVCTPDHNFILRDGSECEAQYLKPDSSLMPFRRGINDGGYEYIVDPWDENENTGKWNFLSSTHRMVAEGLGWDIEGMDVHHEDENKFNNNPTNLEVMTKSDHSKLHGDIHAKCLIEYNKSDRHRQETADYNRLYNKGQNIIDYNNSEKHKEDNAIRSCAVKEFRAKQDPKKYNKRFEIKFVSELIDFLRQVVDEEPGISIDELGKKLQNSDVMYVWRDANNRKLKNVHRHLVLQILRHFGFENFREFKKKVVNNHKVLKIEWLDETQDTGCITVAEWHNFAISSGCVIRNSMDEDLFLPVRKGKRSTEVEVLAGPEGQQVEDAEYFLNKIFAALKIPKTYLGADETVGRANLCLVPETKIPLLDGRVLTMEQLIAEHKDGKQNWVYSINNNKNVVPGKISNAKWTRKNADIVRVHLDNGEYLDVTPDHPFMLRDGSYLEASKLSEGQSLMPWYHRLSDNKLKGYSEVYDPGKNKYQFTHRLVKSFFEPLIKGYVTHHKDFKKLNNNPDNLVQMLWADHQKLHMEQVEKTILRSDVIDKAKKGRENWINSEENKNVCRENMKKARMPGGGQYRWIKSQKHRDLKSEQMKKQWTNGDFSYHKSDEHSRLMRKKMFKRIENGTAPDTRGDKNTRWRNISYDELGSIALNLGAKSKADLIRNGYSQCLVDRIMVCHGKTFKEFSDEFLGGYKLPNFQGLISVKQLADIAVDNKWKTKTELMANGFSRDYIKRVLNQEKLTFEKFLVSYLGVKYRRYKRIDIGDMTVEKLGSIVLKNGITSRKKLVKFGFSRTFLKKVLERENVSLEDFSNKYFGSYKAWKKLSGNNHKIVKLEWLKEKKDCCDIEVDKFHNFATYAGVFVHNSQMDVRFARTVMRVQREMKNGYTQVGRVDLSARNIDPDRVGYECHMVIPSGVFELAQMEVQQAKMELADRYKAMEFSEYYIWSKVLGIPDEEIKAIQSQRAREGGSDLDKEEAQKVREIMPKQIDKEADKLSKNKKLKDVTPKILAEIQKEQSKFAKRMKEVRLLTQEIRHVVKSQKYYRGRKSATL